MIVNEYTRDALQKVALQNSEDAFNGGKVDLIVADMPKYPVRKRMEGLVLSIKRHRDTAKILREIEGHDELVARHEAAIAVAKARAITIIGEM
jgi:hypothetical protein